MTCSACRLFLCFSYFPMLYTAKNEQFPNQRRTVDGRLRAMKYSLSDNTVLCHAAVSHHSIYICASRQVVVINHQ